MERTVLHVDCNKFYASVECLHRPELRDKPVAVGGSTESRHGIILTKNEIASRYGLVGGAAVASAAKVPAVGGGAAELPAVYALFQDGTADL